MHHNIVGLWEGGGTQTGDEAGNPHREGDGRVPLASARLDGVQIHYVKGVHGGLANVPAVYTAAFDFLPRVR